LGKSGDTTKHTWMAFGWSTKALGHLIDKYLIQIDTSGKLLMYELLCELGRQMSQVESTRMWMLDAEIAIKTNFKVQGLFLLGSKAIFPAKKFALMKDLRILLVDGATGKCFSYFPKTLTLISWLRIAILLCSN